MPFVNDADLIDAIKSYLGEPVVKVEIADKQWVQVLNAAKRWFMAKKGLILTKMEPLQVNQSEYVMTDDVENVLDVILDMSPDLIAFFSLGAFDIIPFGFPFAFPTTPSTLQYSGFVQLLQFNELRKRIFSVEPSFEYDQQSSTLRISPTPFRGGNMLITYKTRVFDVSALLARDEELFYEYSLAQAMLVLGRIRSKYSEYPTAGGSATMDGGELTTEAKELIERLNQEISDSQGTCGFISG
jgi:hypothetical protein